MIEVPASVGSNIVKFTRAADKVPPPVQESPEESKMILRVPLLPPGVRVQFQLENHQAELRELNAVANSAFQVDQYFFLHPPVFIIREWWINEDDKSLGLAVDWLQNYQTDPIDPKRVRYVDTPLDPRSDKSNQSHGEDEEECDPCDGKQFDRPNPGDLWTIR